MALTKERKILIAVAGVACGIFLVDRVLMGGAVSGPAAAQAAAPVPNVTSVLPANPELTATPTPSVELDLNPSATTKTSLAQRLAHAGRHLPDRTPDAFRPPAAWRTPDTARPPGPEARAFEPRVFADRHPLDAVFASPRGSYAMINGQMVYRGDVRDGMTLSEIGDRWVVWSGNGLQLKIHLDPAR